MKKHELYAVILVIVFAALIILLAISAKATLLPELADAEPWEERIEYYVSKYPLEQEPIQIVITPKSASISSFEPIYDDYEPEYSTGTEGLTYYGCCWITHYCPCSRCCGKSDGITASGTYATPGWTVACGGLPFGTLVQINGHTYCVEDRGVGSMAIDIFVSDHDRAWELGAYWADVWIVG